MNDDTRLDATLRRLDALLDWERRERAQMRVDLAPVSDLLQRLGQPQRAFRSVHVAGTKGKGSVCALVAAGLRSAGLRAGRYTSPHVERLAERIVIDGQPIADGPLATALEAALQAREQAARAGGPGGVASRFDVLTAAAFHAFRAAGATSPKKSPSAPSSRERTANCRTPSKNSRRSTASRPSSSPTSATNCARRWR